MEEILNTWRAGGFKPTCFKFNKVHYRFSGVPLAEQQVCVKGGTIARTYPVMLEIRQMRTKYGMMDGGRQHRTSPERLACPGAFKGMTIKP